MHYTTLISTEELAVQLDDPRLVAIDCRFSLTDPAAGERAYREGHIPGARYAHLDRDLAGPITPTSGRHPLPERETLAARLGAWGVNGRTQAVVYDDAGGAFAARAWWLLRWLGHEKVAVLDGGLPQWRREGRAESSETPVPVATVFSIRAPLVEPVDVEQLQGALARRAVLVMDARAPERFRGETEFIDPVAGHVPGAINHPLQNNLGHDGRFLPAAEIRRRFLGELGDYRPEQTVQMCGSGVTACHNALAMAYAGLEGVRLYAGSWSEWIRDAARPVVREIGGVHGEVRTE